MNSIYLTQDNVYFTHDPGNTERRLFVVLVNDEVHSWWTGRDTPHKCTDVPIQHVPSIVLDYIERKLHLLD